MNDPETDRLRPSKEEFSLFLEKEFPQTKIIIVFREHKKWISSQVQVKGSIKIDEGAEKALKEGASLLPAGVIKVSGKFEKGYE